MPRKAPLEPLSAPGGRLVLRFAIASLAVFVVVGVALHVLLSRDALRHAEDDALEHALFVTRSILERELQPADVRAPVTGERYDELLLLVEQRVLTGGAVRLKVWRPDGTIVFSDEPRLVGVRFPEEEHEMAEVIRDGPIGELTDLSAEENVYERGLAERLHATYAPLRVGGSRTPTAVAELYQDHAATQADAAQTLARQDIVLIAGLALLYVVLLPLVGNAGATLRRQTGDLTRSHKELADLLDERRDLMSRLVRAQEEERVRIAEDIHDDSIQSVTAVALRLDGLRSRIDDPDAIARLEQIQEAVRGALERMRKLMFELRPPALEEAGLAAAFRTYLGRVKTEDGLEFTVENTLPEEPPLELRTIAYRIGQEALANVRKHARATRVDVRIEPANGGLRLTVTDDGVGVAGPPPDLADHFGVLGMRERAAAAGGWCRVDGTLGGGTVVEAWLPLGPGVPVPEPSSVNDELAERTVEP
ncbi:MAG: sensor histidine kinase [Actinomycetota bacterium]